MPQVLPVPARRQVGCAQGEPHLRAQGARDFTRKREREVDVPKAVKHVTPAGVEELRPPTYHFQKPHMLHCHHCVIYLDFETAQERHGDYRMEVRGTTELG